jgi:hypothetical protein
MSGYTDDSSTGHRILAQGRRLLHKPFTAANLALAVREALDAPVR